MRTGIESADAPTLRWGLFSLSSLTPMARIQIELPEQFLFSTDIPIYITHINKAQHLDNAALIALLS